MNHLAGKFIVFEGPEGCGKSTQAALLRDYIAGTGTEAVVTREPGGTVIGEKIREILLDKDHDEMSVETELFLYMAARSQFINEAVKPLLEKGICVISERFLLSTLVYQGMAGGIDTDVIMNMAPTATHGVQPAATILLDIAAEKGLERAGRDNSLDRMESKGLEFHQKVRDGYLTFSKKVQPSVVISSEQQLDEVHSQIISFLSSIG